jgi:hypothetical protein
LYDRIAIYLALLPERVGGQFVAGDAGRAEVRLQARIQNVVTGQGVELSRFLVLLHPAAAALNEIIFGARRQHGIHAGEGVDHEPNQRAIAQAINGSVSMESSSARASSGASTGVLPRTTGAICRKRSRRTRVIVEMLASLGLSQG